MGDVLQAIVDPGREVIDMVQPDHPMGELILVRRRDLRHLSYKRNKM